MKRALSLLLILLTLCLLLSGCQSLMETDRSDDSLPETSQEANAEVLGYASVPGIPDYSGSPYVELNGNVPEFTEEQKTSTSAYEFYSDLDSLGRCGVTHACIGKELMPSEDRESISSVKPSGWINKKYDTSLVDGGYIYNRCHLIGFQLTGENANKENLITGTRYMNVEGMLPFENMVADYIKETENHVMYRVTPIFVDENLVASGVQLEAYSIEDAGEGICFNVFVYNVQPGIAINYLTGESQLNEDYVPSEDSTPTEQPNDDPNLNVETTYILNTNTKRIHLPSCSSVENIREENKSIYYGTKKALLDQEYKACGTCKP